MKKWLSMLLALLMVLSCAATLIACGGDDVTTTTPPPGGDPAADNLASALHNGGYKIIAKEKAGAAVMSACTDLEKAINAITGKKIPVQDDWVKRNEPVPANALEILVGTTNRASSEAAIEALAANRKNSDRDWVITMKNKEVVITGATEAGTVEAVKAFIAMLGESTGKYSLETYDSGIQQYAWEVTAIGGANAGDFVIVTAEEPSEVMQAYAASVQDAFYEKTGFRPEIVTTASAASAAEIILGANSRPESQALVTLLDEHRANNVMDYRVKATGSKIAVVAGSEAGLADAVTYFNENGILSDVSALNYNKVYEGFHAVTIGGTPVSDFQIVVAKDAPYDVKYMGLLLRNFFWENGYDVTVVTDAVAATAKEIVLGKTNRTESATLDNDLYAMTVKNGKLVVDAGHYYGVTTAVEAFIEAFADAEGDVALTDAYAQRGDVEIPLTYTPNGTLQPLLNRLGISTYANGTYNLVWNDEFHGSKMNWDKWSGKTCMWLDDQRLSVEEGIVDVIDGKMVLTSVKNEDAFPDKGYGETYTTNYSIATNDTMNFQYGYVEMEAELPYYGKGEWPSFWIQGRGELGMKDWMLENNRRPHYFVEVDILEVFSSARTLYCNLHKWYFSYSEHYLENGPANSMINDSTGANANGTSGRTYTFSSGEVARQPHRYGYLWTNEFMAFSIDGDYYYAYDLKDEFGRGGMEDYTQPQFLIINNQFYTELYFENRNSDGTAIKDEILPLKYNVDYVRLYQLPDYGGLWTTEVPGTGKDVVNTSYDTSVMPTAA